MTSLEHFGYRQELRRALTVRDLVIYGMVFMVPVAPFAVFGFVFEHSKGMVPLAYLVGLVGMFYVGRGLHEVAGFFARKPIAIEL